MLAPPVLRLDKGGLLGAESVDRCPDIWCCCCCCFCPMGGRFCGRRSAKFRWLCCERALDAVVLVLSLRDGEDCRRPLSVLLLPLENLREGRALDGWSSNPSSSTVCSGRRPPAPLLLPRRWDRPPLPVPPSCSTTRLDLPPTSRLSRSTRSLAADCRGSELALPAAAARALILCRSSSSSTLSRPLPPLSSDDRRRSRYSRLDPSWAE